MSTFPLSHTLGGEVTDVESKPIKKRRWLTELHKDNIKSSGKNTWSNYNIIVNVREGVGRSGGLSETTMINMC